MMGPSRHQTGAILITALIFLVILTLISITAMRSSTMALRMAGNEQEHRRALQATQSAVAGVLSKTSLQVTNVGEKSCFRFNTSTTVPTDCTTTQTLAEGPGYGTPNVVAAKLDELGPCPRGIGNSARGQGSMRTDGSTTAGSCAYFTIESRYDDTATRGGAAETAEGFVKLAY
jgi:hypothetical protein